MNDEINAAAQVLQEEDDELLDEWLQELKRAGGRREDLMLEGEWREDCDATLGHLRGALLEGGADNLESDAWQELESFFAELCRTRVDRGFTPRENALFIFTLKRPLFRRLRRSLKDDPEQLVEEISELNRLMDLVGLWAVETYQQQRDRLIQRQQEELLELSTPVVKLWKGILALPLIGTLDSGRAQVVLEALLENIVETGAEIAILDITGVPTVDTLVAQHLLKTVSAARLMGAECIVSGIRPQIAQTIVQLGVDLTGVVTKGTLADAFAYALERQQEGGGDDDEELL